MSTLSTHNLIVSSILGAAIALTGCTVGSTGPNDPNDPNDPNNPPDGEVLRVSGDVTEDATWSGAVEIATEAIIKPGVTIDVAPGTSIEAGSEFLRVEGTLNVNGTAEAPISMMPLTSDNWAGISVESGGSATVTFATGEKASALMYCHTGALACVLDSVEFANVTQAMMAEGPAQILRSRLTNLSNGGITIRAGGNLEITDTYIFHSTHDLIVMSGGSLNADHIEVGGTSPESYEHCDFHIGSADSIRITNSNIISSVVGMMIGTPQQTVIQYNNFMQNGTNADVQDISPGTNSDVDLQFNYWDQYAPSAPAFNDPGFNAANPATQAYAEAGPRM